MRAVAVHAVLAALGLYAAYATWTRVPEPEAVAPGQVTLIRCSEDAFEGLSFESPTNLIEALPSRADGRVVHWITDTRKPPAAPPAPAASSVAVAGRPGTSSDDAGIAEVDAGTAPHPAPATPAPVSPPFRYLANRRYAAYLGRLMPLVAERGLGVIADARLREFGLDTADTVIGVRCGGRALRLGVGGRTYGSGKRYVRDLDTGRVYLVQKALVQDLRSARYKFMRTRLHDFDLTGVAEAVLTGGGARRVLRRHGGEQAPQARWVDAAAPAQRNELYGNWFTRVAALKVRAYLPPGSGPGADLGPAHGGPQPLLEVGYSDRRGPLGKLQLVSVQQQRMVHYYARTEASEGWVVLSSAGARKVVEDLAAVLGQPAPPPR